MKTFLPAIIFGIVLAANAAPKGPSPIISVNTNDILIYDRDAQGNRVPDFSTCGYAGGNTDIPDVGVRVEVAATKGDETARIQRALDYVASCPADTNGVRGAVLLLAGRHEVSGGLLITNSGVVLRGQGMGENGTVLVATGLDRRTLIRVIGRNDRKPNPSVHIADDYVPVGAMSFHLEDVADLKVGDSIRVTRPSTREWIDRLGANEFGGGEGGGWKPGSHDLKWDRVVTSLESNRVTIDAPITTALEKGLGGGSVESFTWPGRITNVGIENLQLESTFDAGNPKDEDHAWCAITVENTADAWVRRVTFRHFAGSAMAVYETCQRVTVEDCLSYAPVSEDGGYRRNTFFTMGQQTLFLRCCSEHGRHDYSVGNCAAGPNAFVQCEATQALSDSGGIESWSSGTLFDLVRIDGNAITLGYRAGNNAGIGWAAANSVLWNCSASVIRCWNPPGAQNWSFASWASFEGDGIWRDSNGFKRPESLYAAQLALRTKRHARFMSRSAKESTNPSVEEAAELIAASHKPAPQLADFITEGVARNPIPSGPGKPQMIDDLPSQKRAYQTNKHTISITNGWIVCDSKLLIGDTTSVGWWRGSIRPDEAPSFEPALTRYVPGRIGRGFTDDLHELAADMEMQGNVSIDQHYGLWYERRRDDHERIRRIDGDVLPPFFDQPFARSGQGLAWDGLSKYDLTKYNPWYWSRLEKFAEICDEQGLVLFNNNYFQHNIIEAGAHWVDGPWRSANNINNTGFPEPPPFAGDKRIFMAEQFYDETNPARRALQQNFIWQNLNNFTNNANVIQFTSAEFTGPLHFVQFWVDTIGEWEQQHQSVKPIIALATTKDVQDAILADPKRAAIVDVIAFRYWWATDRGVYAPKGGLNLSPRQFQRLEHPGNTSDLNLASMAAEYRGKYPAKAVIGASEQGNDLSHAGWAYVCAGGSLPNLPLNTDAHLLAAITQMKPWQADSAKKLWALREQGKQMLIYSGGSGDITLDLTGEPGDFKVQVISQSGQVSASGESITGGGNAILKKQNGRTVYWLTKQ